MANSSSSPPPATCSPSIVSKTFAQADIARTAYSRFCRKPKLQGRSRLSLLDERLWTYHESRVGASGCAERMRFFAVKSG